MTFHSETFPDSDWPAAVAARLSALAPARRLCLATGDTLAPAYALVDHLDGATVFLLDEFGGLPPNDPGRCQSMIRRQLLDHVTVGDLRLPDVDAADAAAEARRYGEDIASGGIDLAVVGLGRNGHIGMNEPGSTVDLPTRVVELAPTTAEHAAAYGASSTPSWGITVGLAELMAAREVWLLVTGEHKREILERVLHDPIGPDLPATFLRNHSDCTVLADRTAAGG